MKLDGLTKAWLTMFVIAIVGTVISLLIGIWWDTDIAMKVWLSTVAITLMPIWLLSGL